MTSASPAPRNLWPPDPKTIVVKSTAITYLLWVVGGLGVLGLHRFYLGKWKSGLLYLLTGGLFGIGWLLDFWGLNWKISEANSKES